MIFFISATLTKGQDLVRDSLRIYSNAPQEGPGVSEKIIESHYSLPLQWNSFVPGGYVQLSEESYRSLYESYAIGVAPSFTWKQYEFFPGVLYQATELPEIGYDRTDLSAWIGFGYHNEIASARIFWNSLGSSEIRLLVQIPGSPFLLSSRMLYSEETRIRLSTCYQHPLGFYAGIISFPVEAGMGISGGYRLAGRLSAGIEYLLPADSTAYAGIELSYSFQRPNQISAESVPKKTDPATNARKDKSVKPVRTKPPATVPDFSLLVRWGLPPAEAWKLQQTRDVCMLSEHSQKILSARNWKCYRN